MNSSQEGERTNDGELRALEKNNYFDGKLMTAHDMRAEQQYHEGRLHRLTRLVTGTGILSGLTVTGVEERHDRLEATVEDGVALDGYGRPIVVTGAESVLVERSDGDGSSAADRSSVPEEDTDVIYLSLAYKELPTESVPVPGSERASERKCEDNRFLETFELTYDEKPPEREPVPSIEFPDEDDVRSADESVLGEIARAYDPHEREARRDPSVFLGAFERDRDGVWTELPDERPPLVHTNDMLYAAIARHVTDFDDPHGGSGTSGPEIPDGVTERLTALERYVMERSLRFTIRSFSTVKERFGTGAAGEIVTTARGAIDRGGFEDTDDYVSHLDRISDAERESVRELKDDVTGDSLERYDEAVDELENVLRAVADGGNALRAAVAQDVVCETADLLRRRRPRVLKTSREVPDLVGIHRTEAEEILIEDDWMFTVEEREGRDKESDVDVNHVMAQTPEPGEEAYVRHRVIGLEVRVPVVLRGDQ